MAGKAQGCADSAWEMEQVEHGQSEVYLFVHIHEAV